jgi:hypothetical protein
MTRTHEGPDHRSGHHRRDPVRPPKPNVKPLKVIGSGLSAHQGEVARGLGGSGRW